MKPILILALLLFSSSVYGSEIQSGPQSEFSTIHLDSAQTDAEQALAQGDKRLLAVRSYSLVVPGTDLTYQEAQKLYGVRLIEHTSDAWGNEAEAAYNRDAFEYARRYNQTILKRLSTGNLG